MATEYRYFQGKCKWARLQGPPDKYGHWSIVLYPNPTSLDEINALKEGPEGIKNVLGKDEDGYFITFRRPQQKTFKGKVQGFAAPEVIKADNTPLKESLIGNGSDVTVKVEVYTYNVPASNGKKAKATRLMSVRVDNLIPYIINRDFTVDQEKQVRGLDEQPAQPLF